MYADKKSIGIKARTEMLRAVGLDHEFRQIIKPIYVDPVDMINQICDFLDTNKSTTLTIAKNKKLYTYLCKLRSVVKNKLTNQDIKNELFSSVMNRGYPYILNTSDDTIIQVHIDICEFYKKHNRIPPKSSERGYIQRVASKCNVDEIHLKKLASAYTNLVSAMHKLYTKNAYREELIKKLKNIYIERNCIHLLVDDQKKYLSMENFKHTCKWIATNGKPSSSGSSDEKKIYKQVANVNTYIKGTSHGKPYKEYYEIAEKYNCLHILPDIELYKDNLV